VAATGLPG